MRFEEYVDWLEDHAKVVEGGHWYIAELELENQPRLAEQGTSPRDALKNLAKRYQRFTERESNQSAAAAKKAVGPAIQSTD